MASARHPWRAISAWIAVAVLAIVTIAAPPRRQPYDRGPSDEQPRVRARRGRSLGCVPHRPGDRDIDIVVIRPRCRRSTRRSSRRSSGTSWPTRRSAALGRARTYLDEGGDALVSRDRHATIVPTPSSTTTRPGRLFVEKADDSEESVFVVSVTVRRRSTTTSISFVMTSTGELQFGRRPPS